MPVDWISFSSAELSVLCAMLGLPELLPSRSVDVEATTRLLRERGAVHATDSEVALPVAELLLLAARPIVDIEVRFAGPSRPIAARLARMRGNARAIVLTTVSDGSMRFTPFASADLLARLSSLCGLDVRPRPHGDGFTTSLAVLDACKDAAETVGSAAARAVLVEAGVDHRDATAFAGALTDVEQTVAVRLTIRVGRISEGVELFWLDAPQARWALPSMLSPFAASPHDSNVVDDAAEPSARWTVDPFATKLTVTPTDGDELLAAVHATLTAVGSRGG